MSVPGRTNWGLMTWRLKKVVQHEENHVKPRKNVIGAHTYAKNGFVILVDSRADITGCKNLCADRDMGCFNDSNREGSYQTHTGADSKQLKWMRKKKPRNKMKRCF